MNEQVVVGYVMSGVLIETDDIIKPFTIIMDKSKIMEYVRLLH